MPFTPTAENTMRNDYGEFICLADEYLISYVCLPCDLLKVKQFLIVHALELYLKAVYFKNTNDYEKTIQFKHDIYKLFKSCKVFAPSFLADVVIEEKILQIFQSKNAHQKICSNVEQMKNYPFYLACYYAGNLKYFGLKNKSINFNQDIVESGDTIYYWAEIFNKIRNYLKFPETSNTIDLLNLTINKREFNDVIINRLKRFTLK